MRLWETATGKPLRQMKAGSRAEEHYAASICAAAFSHNGKTLALGTDLNVIQLFDTTSGKEITALGGHHGTITAIHPSADGKTLTTVAVDGILFQWDIATGKERRRQELPAGTSEPVPDA